MRARESPPVQEWPGNLPCVQLLSALVSSRWCGGRGWARVPGVSTQIQDLRHKGTLVFTPASCPLGRQGAGRPLGRCPWEVGMHCVCSVRVSVPRCYPTASHQSLAESPQSWQGAGEGSPFWGYSAFPAVRRVSPWATVHMRPAGQSHPSRRLDLALSCRQQRWKKGLALRGLWPERLPSLTQPPPSHPPHLHRALPFVTPDNTRAVVTTGTVQLQHPGRGKRTKEALNPLPVGLDAGLAGVPRWHSQRGGD